MSSCITSSSFFFPTLHFSFLFPSRDLFFFFFAAKCLIQLVLVSLRSLHTVQLEESRGARVSLPIKVIFGLAAAFELEAALFARGAVREGDVIVGDVLEKVDFLLFEGQPGGDGVDGRVAPALVEEAAFVVEGVEEIKIGFGAQPVEVSDFEIGPLEGRLG